MNEPDFSVLRQRARCVILGRVGMDLYADPPGAQIEQASQYMATIGGSAGNIAVALARQGVGAALLTRVSGDAVGRFCAAQLAAYDVDTQHIQIAGGGARTSLAVVETRPSDAQTVLYRNGAADFDLTQDDIAGVNFASFGALVVTGTALASEPSCSASFAAMARARAAGALVVLDIDYRAYSWPSTSAAAQTCLRAAQLCDIVIGNDDEFGLLAGDYAQGAALAQRLAYQGALFCSYKRGAEGARSFTRDGQIDTPIFAVSARKPMGAGDGFMGGLLAALVAGHPLERALARGAATAAMIVAGIGCAPASPSAAQLDAFMKSYT